VGGLPAALASGPLPVGAGTVSAAPAIPAVTIKPKAGSSASAARLRFQRKRRKAIHLASLSADGVS
jgi:hypothetical protein